MAVMRLGFLALLVSSVAFAQADVRVEVRAAFEEQAPLPSRPLVLPAPAAAPTRVDTRVRAAESARVRADEATQHGRGRSMDRIAHQKDGRGELGQAGVAATGQARAEEARKNNRNGKPPHPPKP